MRIRAAFLPAGCPERPANVEALLNGIYAGAIYQFAANDESRAFVALCAEAFKEMSIDFSGGATRPPTPKEVEFTEQLDGGRNDLKARLFALARTPAFVSAIRAVLQSHGLGAESVFQTFPPRAIAHDTVRGRISGAPPHRDTWFAAPQTQINWWLALADIKPGNTISFRTDYFARPARNSSSNFDADEMLRIIRSGRRPGDPDKMANAELMEEMSFAEGLRPEVAGGEMLAFSAAHLHASYSDTPSFRASAEFRSVSLADDKAGLGAPNVDDESRGAWDLGTWPAVAGDAAQSPVERPRG